MLEKIFHYVAWFLIVLFVVDLMFFGGMIFISTQKGMPIPLGIPIIFISAIFLVGLKVKNFRIEQYDATSYSPQIYACVFALVFILLYHSMWINMIILMFLLTLVFYIYSIALFIKLKKRVLASVSFLLLIGAILMLPFVKIPGILIVNGVSNALFLIYIKSKHYQAKKLEQSKHNHFQLINITSFIHLFIALVPAGVLIISSWIILIQKEGSLSEGLQFLTMLGFFPSIFYCGPLIMIGIVLSFIARSKPLIMTAIMSLFFWGGYWAMFYQYSSQLGLTASQMGLLGAIYLIYLSCALWAYTRRNKSFIIK